MMLLIRADKFRLRLYLPRSALPFALRLAARTDADADEKERQLMLAFASAMRQTHWRRYRGLELVRVKTDDTEVVVRI